MIDNNAPYRPGLAAIAAVLALSSTPVIAQVVLPADPAAAVPAAPVAAAPQPTAQAPVQTVQSVPVTPTLPDIAIPEKQASASRAQAPTQRMAKRMAQAEEARPAPAAAQRVPSPEVAPAQDATPKASPSTMAAAPEAAPPASVPQQEASLQTPATSDGGNYASWILLGGGLLLVGGGAAFALSRRPKRRSEETDGYVTTDENSRIVTAAPVFVSERAVSRPIHDPVPQRSVATPVAMAQVQRTAVDRPVSERRAALESLIAEQPSAANPFRSRRNRLRRADFLLRTGQAEPRQGEYALTEERQAEPAGAKDRWSEMRFRGRENTRVSWKPATR